MNYPLAEQLIARMPLHLLVKQDKVIMELYGVTQFVPDPDAICRQLHAAGLVVIPVGCIEQMETLVEERLDGLQGREGYGPPT